MSFKNDIYLIFKNMSRPSVQSVSEWPISQWLTIATFNQLVNTKLRRQVKTKKRPELMQAMAASWVAWKKHTELFG